MSVEWKWTFLHALCVEWKCGIKVRLCSTWLQRRGSEGIACRKEQRGISRWGGNLWRESWGIRRPPQHSLAPIAPFALKQCLKTNIHGSDLSGGVQTFKSWIRKLRWKYNFHPSNQLLCNPSFCSWLGPLTLETTCLLFCTCSSFHLHALKFL